MLEFLFYRFDRQGDQKDGTLVFLTPVYSWYEPMLTYDAVLNNDGTVNDYQNKDIVFPYPGIAIASNPDDECVVLCSNGQQYLLGYDDKIADPPLPLTDFYYDLIPI